MDYLQKLIAEGEHQQLDFKFEISDARKIARTMVAFANTDGGRLLVGVKDNGAIAGVRSEEEIFMLEGAADMYCKPVIKFKAVRWKIGLKTVVEVIINPGNRRPYYASETDGRWMAYIRVKDQNLLANDILLKVWARQKEGIATTLRFSGVEEFLLKYLGLNDAIDFEGFCEIARLTKTEAEQILVNLLSLELLHIDISEKGVLYRLNRQSFESD
ncbi:MAG: ATP-binding protein [Bacteroidota bacterium]